MLVCLEYQCDTQKEDTAKILDTDTFEIIEITRTELFSKFISKDRFVYNLFCDPKNKTVDRVYMENKGNGLLVAPYYVYGDWFCMTVSKNLLIYNNHKFIWQSDDEYTDIDIQPIFSSMYADIIGLIVKASSATAYLELYELQGNRLIKISDKDRLSKKSFDAEAQIPWGTLGRKSNRCECMSDGSWRLIHNYDIDTYFYYNLDDFNFYAVDKEMKYDDWNNPSDVVVNLLIAPFVKNVQDSYKDLKDSMIVVEDVRKYTSIFLQYQSDMLNYMLKYERKRLCEKFKIFDITITLRRNFNDIKMLDLGFDIESYSEPYEVYTIQGGTLCL